MQHGLRFNAAPCVGHFFLPLTGLRPGVYFYKFIVDGTWTVDPSAPKVIDTSGNYNNVLEVRWHPHCSSFLWSLLTHDEALMRCT